MTHLELVLDHERNRELLADWLADRYEVSAGAAPELADAVDLCLADPPAFERHREAFQTWKRTADPVFAPVVLVTSEPLGEAFDPEGWQTIDGLYVVDDVVSVPVDRTVLHRRLENLLERRSLSARLQRKYRRTKGQLDSLFEALPDPALVLDDEDCILAANDAIGDLVESDPDALAGARIGSAIPLGDEALHTALDCVSRARGSDAVETIDLSFETDADAGRRHFELSARSLDVAEEPGVCVVLRDITARTERQAKLVESEIRFRQIAAHVEENIWMLDADTLELLYASPGVKELVADADSLAGTTVVEAFLDRVHEADSERVRTEIEAALDAIAVGDTETDLRLEFRYRRPDAGVRWLHLEASVVPDGDGDPTRIVGMTDDVTALKRREQELASQNERLEEFAAIVSHDLRNPIQVILGGVDRLRHGGGEAAVDDIERSAERMTDMVDNLLSLARAGEDLDEPHPVALETVANRAGEQVDAPGATLALPNGGSIMADEDRLQQLFENLFRNAVEHASPTVSISVDLLRDESGSITGFAVADDGPGIPPAERDRVLESGYTTAEGGTGFGLDIVSDIADAHGWSLSLTESADGGARFEFRGVEPA
ncbi:MAG: PAS domain-containing sensor histidine kinase [Haloarculaceae archaeon]